MFGIFLWQLLKFCIAIQMIYGFLPFFFFIFFPSWILSSKHSLSVSRTITLLTNNLAHVYLTYHFLFNIILSHHFHFHFTPISLLCDIHSHYISFPFDFKIIIFILYQSHSIFIPKEFLKMFIISKLLFLYFTNLIQFLVQNNFFKNAYRSFRIKKRK